MMKDTDKEKIQRLRARAALIDAKLKRMEKMAFDAERKHNTRQKIIVGGWLLSRVKQGDEHAKRLFDEMLASEMRPADRKAFDV